MFFHVFSVANQTFHVIHGLFAAPEPGTLLKLSCFWRCEQLKTKTTKRLEFSRTLSKHVKHHIIILPGNRYETNANNTTGKTIENTQKNYDTFFALIRFTCGSNLCKVDSKAGGKPTCTSALMPYSRTYILQDHQLSPAAAAMACFLRDAGDAAGKCIISNARDCVRHHHLCQAAAATKCPEPDACDRVGDLQMR